MKYYHLLFFILILTYSCSSISKKNKSNYYVPNIDIKRVKVVNGQLSLLKCVKDFRNEYSIKFNKNEDSLIFNSSINFCDLYKDDLLKGSYLISNIVFYVKPNEKKLKYSSYEYGVFDSNKNIVVKKSGGGMYCFIQDREAYKKTIHYKLFDAKFKIINSTVSLDSISSINMVNKFIRE